MHANGRGEGKIEEIQRELCELWSSRSETRGLAEVNGQPYLNRGVLSGLFEESHAHSFPALATHRNTTSNVCCCLETARTSASPRSEHNSAEGVGVLATHSKGEPGSDSPSSETAILYTPDTSGL